MTHKTLKLLAGTLILGLVLTGCSSGSKTSPEEDITATTEAPEEVQALGGECNNVMRYLNRTVVVLGSLGETSTLEDLIPVLQENGEIITGGFGVSELGSGENYKLVNGAGTDLLKMRVNLLEGTDPSSNSSAFLEKYTKIKEMCPGF
jgi:hypothetical protein